MEPKWPVYVLVKDCGEISEYSSLERLRFDLEAIDVENDEFDVWDAEGREVRLRAERVTRWRSGTINIDSVGQQTNPHRLKELKAKAKSR
jgi:hypothetical protein